MSSPSDLRRYCLLGGLVDSSPSQHMMNAAFRSLGIPAEYTLLSVGQDLDGGMEAIRRGGFDGFNVTIPHKVGVVERLDRVDRASRSIGAVNTVKRAGGAYTGYNTDVDGITRPLRSHFGDGGPASSLLLGAGGAARAFLWSMREMGCRRVSVLVRDLQKGRSLLEMPLRGMEVGLFGMDATDLPRFELMFNATPLGSHGGEVPGRLLALAARAEVFFDAVYQPAETGLVAAARDSGRKVIRGHEMLLEQGASSFKIWTGREAPRGTMREALLSFLKVEAT
ncbi:MAG: shikimate dehydrogenase [Nitrososphaerota archaeon]|nr:shikimate dehydrogenase [Nitrososphaerota archaeon]MDG6938823.1 shikimate dehydrogenase [Nitrososphaerota archaeon]